MRFLHVMLRVKDIDKSLKFYQNLFNLNLTHTIKLEDSILYYLSDEDGQTQIELTVNFDIPEGGYTNGTAFGHLAFGIDSFDKFNEKLSKMGIEYICEPFILKEADSVIAFIKDPDGNEIEIIKEL